MNEYLTDLINRMNDESDKDKRNSAETISWQALREAEKLNDKDLIEPLSRYIESEKNKKNRDRAYFILGKLGKNLKDTQICDFLISRIKNEEDKYIISSLLDRISEIPKSELTNIEPLIKATENKQWQIRQSAIQALRLTKNQNAENVLIEILKTSKDQFDLTYSNSVLGDIGTEKSLPFLKVLIESSKEGVAHSAFTAYQKIADVNGIDIYRHYLTTGKLKTSAITGVVQYGDSSDIELIEKRIKELVSRKRSREIIYSDGKNEIIIGLEFLKRFDEYASNYKKTLTWLSVKKRDKLWDSELKWIEDELAN